MLIKLSHFVRGGYRSLRNMVYNHALDVGDHLFERFNLCITDRQQLHINIYAKETLPNIGILFFDLDISVHLSTCSFQQ